MTLSLMKKDTGKRNPWIQLDISAWSAKEFFEELCHIYLKVEELEEKTRYNDAVDEKFRKSRMFQRALWIALIIEIGRLFDTFEKPDKKVISLKQTEFFRNPAVKNKVNAIFGHNIISRIIHTRNTYTAHINENKGDVVSVPEICKSNLGELLKNMHILISQFLAYQKNEKAIEAKTP